MKSKLRQAADAQETYRRSELGRKAEEKRTFEQQSARQNQQESTGLRQKPTGSRQTPKGLRQEPTGSSQKSTGGGDHTLHRRHHAFMDEVTRHHIKGEHDEVTRHHIKGEHDESPPTKLDC